MRTKYRFIEGYEGNDTVRGWREYDSIYHAVFACMRGTPGYPKGPAVQHGPAGAVVAACDPNAEVFQGEGTYGPRANFKISLRELPDHGRFRVTVTAAKYDDGLLLDPGTAARSPETADSVVCRDLNAPQTVTIKQPGIYQVDVHRLRERPAGGDAEPGRAGSSRRHAQQPAFLVVRLAAGALPVRARLTGPARLDRIVLTPLAADDPLARRFTAFEKRSPRLGVHMGFRRDCGSTLSQVGTAADGREREASRSSCSKGPSATSPARTWRRTTSIISPAFARSACGASTPTAATCRGC